MRFPRDDPREDVGVGIGRENVDEDAGVVVVECGLYGWFGAHKCRELMRRTRRTIMRRRRVGADA